MNKLSNSVGLRGVDWRRLLPGYAAAWGIAMMPSHVLPFLVGSLVAGLHLTETEAGIFVSAELGMIGLVAIGLAPLMNRVPRRGLAMAGIVLILISNGASMLVGGGAPLLACRVISGAALGIMLAVGNATFASSQTPDRLYAQATLLNVIVLVALFNLLPLLIGPFAQRSVYILIIAVTLAMAPAMLLLPAMPLKDQKDQEVRKTPHAPRNRIAVIVAISVVLIYYIRDTIVWAFAQQTGLRTGLTTDQIGMVFGIHAVVALFGPATAAHIGVRFGRAIPLTIGILSTGTITYLVSQTSSPIVYIAMILPWTGAHHFTLSYLMGMAGELDPDGGVISAAGGAILIGTAVSPALAGVLVSYGGYPMLGWVSIALVMVTLALALWLAGFLARQPRSLDFRREIPAAL